MVYFLYTLFFVSCVALIASVLLQPGKTDAGALFTSNISSTAFQPRGSQTILSKITIVAATIFMISALLLAMPALTGNLSVLETVGETPTETAPATDATNSNTDANAANINAAVSNDVNTTNANLSLNTNSTANTNAAGNTATNTNAAANTTTNKATN